MERNLRLNWQFLVDEARQRRKAQGLTQRRLAGIAGVSTPTVSRFEQAGKDIQMSSVLSILDVLGMTDKRTLDFQQEEPVYDSGRMVVTFQGVDAKKRIPCAISREALEDHFGGNRKDPVVVFKANADAIEQLGRRKYLRGEFEPDGSVLIRTSDLILS